MKALERTKTALGVSSDRDWLHRHYQYANRLTILNFLRENGVATRLLLVYFVGDNLDNADCPKDEAGWDVALSAQARSLGLNSAHPFQSIFTHFLCLSLWIKSSRR